MEELKKMKECLMAKVEGQIYSNLDTVNTAELGAAIDMIKDLSEAAYYCSIVKSMEESSEKEEEGKEHKGMMYYAPRKMMYEPYPVEYYDPRYRETMYAQGGGRGGSMRGNGGGRSSGGNNARGGGTRGYSDGNYTMYDDGSSSNYSMYHEDMMYPQDMYPIYRDGMMKDPREGRSGMRRKMYMEGKGMKDKNKQMQELEQYMQELASDMTEMIQDASPEEKQLLQSKIAALAAKVK